MDLENKEWKEFFIEDVFKIKSGKRLTKADMKDGKTPFIGATDSNNGITEFVSNKNSSLDKNVLGVNYNGSVVHNFYHPYQALFSDDVKRLSFKNTKGNRFLFLFVKTIILQQKSKYEYGYKFNGTRMKRQKILLPINENGNPDYVFMENYMRKKETELITKYQKYISSKIKHLEKKLDKEVEWKEFLFPEIFEIRKGFYNKKPESSNKGKIPFLGATANNNGITEFYTLSEIEQNSKTGKAPNHPLKKKIFNGNCIAVTNNGSVGFAYYQVADFTCSHDINPLYLKNHQLNREIAYFLITAIEKQKVCFEYARKWRPMRMIKSKILLPVTEKGNPDFEYMENYIKRIEQEKLMNYLKYKELNIS